MCLDTTSTQCGFSLGPCALEPVLMLDPGRTMAVEVLGLGTLLHSGPGLYLRGSALTGLFNPDLFGVVVVVVAVETDLSLDVSPNLALPSLDSHLLLLLLFVFSGSLLTCAFAPSSFLSGSFPPLLPLFSGDSASLFSSVDPDLDLVWPSVLGALFDWGDFCSCCDSVLVLDGDDFSSFESVLRRFRGTSEIHKMLIVVYS